MCHEGNFVSSNGGKQRPLHRLKFLTIRYGFHKVLKGNRVNFGAPNEFTELSSDLRQVTAEHCDVTVSPNPLPFFVGKFGGSLF